MRILRFWRVSMRVLLCQYLGVEGGTVGQWRLRGDLIQFDSVSVSSNRGRALHADTTALAPEIPAPFASASLSHSG